MGAYENSLAMPDVLGCTDPSAGNYNPLANLDDGTCCYVNITQNDTTICFGDSVTLNVAGPLIGSYLSIFH